MAPAPTTPARARLRAAEHATRQARTAFGESPRSGDTRARSAESRAASSRSVHAFAAALHDGVAARGDERDACEHARAALATLVDADTTFPIPFAHVVRELTTFPLASDLHALATYLEDTTTTDAAAALSPLHHAAITTALHTFFVTLDADDDTLRYFSDARARMLAHAISRADFDTRFPIVRTLGHGGQTDAVNLVRDAMSENALRVARVCKNAHAFGLLATEAELVATLPAHPHIARVLGVHLIQEAPQTPPTFVEIMEHAPGDPLHRLLGTPRFRPKELAIRAIGTQLLDALAHIHAHEIVHRDLKPSNVVVELHDGVPHVRIVDFGLARDTRREPRSSSVAGNKGTLDYMAPEQVRGESPNGTWDLYAAGLIVLDLILGKERHRRPARPPLEELAETRAKSRTALVGQVKFSDDLFDQIERLLSLDPRTRMTARFDDGGAVELPRVMAIAAPHAEVAIAAHANIAHETPALTARAATITVDESSGVAKSAAAEVVDAELVEENDDAKPTEAHDDGNNTTAAQAALVAAPAAAATTSAALMVPGAAESTAVAVAEQFRGVGLQLVTASATALGAVGSLIGWLNSTFSGSSALGLGAILFAGFLWVSKDLKYTKFRHTAAQLAAEALAAYRAWRSAIRDDALQYIPAAAENALRDLETLSIYLATYIDSWNSIAKPDQDWLDGKLLGEFPRRGNYYIPVANAIAHTDPTGNFDYQQLPKAKIFHATLARAATAALRSGLRDARLFPTREQYRAVMARIEPLHGPDFSAKPFAPLNQSLITCQQLLNQRSEDTLHGIENWKTLDETEHALTALEQLRTNEAEHFAELRRLRNEPTPDEYPPELTFRGVEMASNYAVLAGPQAYGDAYERAEQFFGALFGELRTADDSKITRRLSRAHEHIIAMITTTRQQMAWQKAEWERYQRLRVARQHMQEAIDFIHAHSTILAHVEWRTLASVERWMADCGKSVQAAEDVANRTSKAVNFSAFANVTRHLPHDTTTAEQLAARICEEIAPYRSLAQLRNFDFVAHSTTAIDRFATARRIAPHLPSGAALSAGKNAMAAKSEQVAIIVQELTLITTIFTPSQRARIADAMALEAEMLSAFTNIETWITALAAWETTYAVAQDKSTLPPPPELFAAH